MCECVNEWFLQTFLKCPVSGSSSGLLSTGLRAVLSLLWSLDEVVMEEEVVGKHSV